jgi:hypothetical protein
MGFPIALAMEKDWARNKEGGRLGLILKLSCLKLAPDREGERLKLVCQMLLEWIVETLTYTHQFNQLILVSARN